MTSMIATTTAAMNVRYLKKLLYLNVIFRNQKTYYVVFGMSTIQAISFLYVYAYDTRVLESENVCHNPHK
jgi:phosphotransferase system IIB component